MSEYTLQVLMPMGGLGSRFAKEGYTVPKPMIEVDGKPMFMRALDSFNGIENLRYIFVIRKEHDEAYDLANQIRLQLPDAHISILDHDTGGAVETCLVAKDAIDDTLPVTVVDCDSYVRSATYFEKIARIEQEGTPDGLILTFPSDNPRFSYVELDENNRAIRTAEKVVISNHAILGGYFFRSGALFKELAEEFMATGLPEGLKEYYMSHLYNLLLERGGSFEIADIDEVAHFGTPEELNNYLQSQAKG